LYPISDAGRYVIAKDVLNCIVKEKRSRVKRKMRIERTYNNDLPSTPDDGYTTDKSSNIG
jgi:hypothetical protein